MASEKKQAGSAAQAVDQERMGYGVVHIHPAYREESEATIDLLSQGQIGMGLRGMYEDLLNQPVPEHLADLIRRLS